MNILAACIVAGGVTVTSNASAATGETTIAKWRGGRTCAVALAFDDSLWSHVDYVIPLLARKGLVGSFWVNPATNRYGYGIETWEGEAQDLGMELCSHTMNHTGASSFEEADYEIGECTRILRSLRKPGAGRFMLFLRGGATEWKITDEQMKGLIKKYELHRGRGGGVDHGGDDKTAEELVGYVKAAEADGGFHCIGFHGVGQCAEWLPASATAFEPLVDYLASARDRVWNGTCGEVCMYQRERESAKVTVQEATDRTVRLDLSCAEDPPYDAALTLDTRVPDSWKRCLIRRGEGSVVRPVRDGVVRYEAVPGRGEIVLAATTDPETRPPARRATPPARKPQYVGKPILTVDRVPEGKAETRELPAGLKDASVGFSFRVSKDFSIPEFAKGGGNVLTLLGISDGEGRPLATVNVYRQGTELALYALLQDNKDWQGIPGWPEIPAGHLVLAAGGDHEVLLRTRAGYRDGGAELWLDGKLRCSFTRRDTVGRAANSLSVGTVSKPDGMRGGVVVTGVKATGE